MATARLKEVKEYILTLSQDEVDVLASVVGSIGGTGPARKITDEIFDQLEAAGAVHQRFPITGILQV